MSDERDDDFMAMFEETVAFIQKAKRRGWTFQSNTNGVTIQITVSQPPEPTARSNPETPAS